MPTTPSPDRLQLRPASAGDYTTIASWIPDATACLRWAGPKLPFPFPASDLRQLLAAPDGSDHSYSLVDQDDMPWGFGQHWIARPGAVHLGRIIMAPAARGLGLGRLLCEELVAAALEATAATIVTLRVYRDNPAAMTLYANLGFRAVDTQSTADVLFMAMHVPARG